LREKKYEQLLKLDLKKVKWTELKPISPFYFFVPKDERSIKRFQSYPSITDIFPVNSVGIVTARDHFVIDFDRQILKRRITEFVNSTLDDDLVSKAYNLQDTGAWSVKEARRELMKEENLDKYFTKLFYRPFDIRQLFYHDAVIERSRKEVMQHMLQQNIALLTHRREELQIGYSHFLVTDCISEHGALSSKTTEYQFPLYIFPEETKSKRHSNITMMLFEPEVPYGKKRCVPNLALQLMESLKLAYKKQPIPEDIFNYIYAVVYSNVYRKKYAEFLKTDFPRVPFTKDYRLFQKLAEKGKQLVELHLLKSKELNKPIAKCEGSGELRIFKVSYDEKKHRVYINPDKYFASVPSEVWEYHIGGYQVAEKWLKDRKNRTLSSEEIATYVHTITAIAKTIEIQESLDDLFKEVEASLLEVSFYI